LIIADDTCWKLWLNVDFFADCHVTFSPYHNFLFCFPRLGPLLLFMEKTIEYNNDLNFRKYSYAWANAIMIDHSPYDSLCLSKHDMD